MTTDLEPLAQQVDDSLTLGKRFTWTKTSLQLSNPGVAPTMEELAEAGRVLGRIGNSALWWIGDWMAIAEKAYGSTYAQGQKITGLASGTLANLVSVCRAVESSRRREVLSFGHHAAVAPLAPWAQVQWLGLAESEGLSVMALRARITGDRELPGPSPARLQLIAPPERAERWKAAADLAGLAFDEWAANALDEAAA